MDPMSALSVAAAVIQFVDFGGHLLSDTYEIYISPSGQKDNLVQLSALASDLLQLSDQVDRKSRALTQNEQHAKSENQLLKLCSECKTTSKDLQNALDLLKTRGTKTFCFDKNGLGGSFRVALQGIWSHKKIEKMVEDLANIRRRMMMALLVSVWYLFIILHVVSSGSLLLRDDSKRSQERDIQFSKQLDSIIDTLNRLDQTKNNILSEEMISIANEETNPVRKELEKILWDPLWDKKIALDIPAQSCTDTEESKIFSEKVRTSIIDSVSFETLQAREEAIPEVFQTTCQWIFQEHPTEVEGKLLWSSFPVWLESSAREIYWITGKPGSGKSTLMKFIIQHELATKHLEVWAHGSKILLASYYSWNGGLDMQKSREGLMKTLLFQALTLFPDLTPQVVPRRWALMHMLHNAEAAPAWKLAELRESLRNLLSECGESFKVAVFIDGLDEFESPPTQILELIHEINTYHGVKLCVAGRPWIEFEDAFNECPMLRMEQLTDKDIEFFTRKRFELNRGFKLLKNVFPNEADMLLQDIVRKAQGVFLWVSLVVRALLEGVTEGDRMSDLQQIVKEVPSDISKLYDHIWANIRPRNIANSSELFQLFQSAIGPLDCITLWLADEKKPLETDINSISSDSRKVVQELMRRRLDSRTRGILEISPSGLVNFLHRTAADWTRQPNVREGIKSAAPNFDPCIALLQAETIRLVDKTSFSITSEQYYQFWDKVLKCLSYASRAVYSETSDSKLIQILDKVDVEARVLSKSFDSIFRELRVSKPWRYSHWSVFQDTHHLPARKNSFVGLAAQFCITPYVNAKISSDRSLLWKGPSKHSVSILENAVLGPKYFTNPILYSGGSAMYVQLFLDFNRRLEFVEFLLEKGARPGFDDLIISEVNSPRMGLLGDSYTKDVTELLKKHMGLKRVLKSAKNVLGLNSKNNSGSL
jgi:energy-coupling factor transporter ATP-binding protein EcfA2